MPGTAGAEFKSAGFTGDMPIFAKTNASPLVAWMLQSLTAQGNCMPDDTEWGHQDTDRLSAPHDDILSHFDEMQTSDIIALNDQNPQVDRSWPERLRPCDVDAR